MKIVRAVLGVSAILFVVFAVGAVRGTLPGRNYWHARDVAANVKTAIPLGSTPAQVQTYLDAQGMQGSFMDARNAGFNSDFLFLNTPAWRKANVGGTTYATLPWQTWGVMAQNGLQITFVFDKRRLLSHILINRSSNGY